jgi:hypothetical protein
LPLANAWKRRVKQKLSLRKKGLAKNKQQSHQEVLPNNQAKDNPKGLKNRIEKRKHKRM